MIRHEQVNIHQLRQLIHKNELTLAGNQDLKIYGRLDCASGERMKKKNRVFFKHEAEALGYGFRPCGHCLKSQYLKWMLKAKGHPDSNRELTVWG